MRKRSRASSGSGGIVCPFCELGDVETRRSDPRCSSCDRAVGDMLGTLLEIAALPDVFGRHACECGHPEMRRHPDGVFHCPACGSEVLPFAGEPISGSRAPAARLPKVQ